MKNSHIFDAFSAKRLLKSPEFKYLEIEASDTLNQDFSTRSRTFFKSKTRSILGVLNADNDKIKYMKANASSILPGTPPPMLQGVMQFGERKGVDPVELIENYSKAAERHLKVPSASLDLSMAYDVISVIGENFSTLPIIEQFYGSKILLFDGVESTYGGAVAFEKMFSDPQYRLMGQDDELDVAIFVHRALDQDLPVHFFTIVLNGEPFIRYHETMLQKLPFKWHWHIIEGVAQLVHDTAWSIASGGHIPSDFHFDGLSTDGTTTYIDSVARRFPENVTVYRKPKGMFWNGKIEMIRAPLEKIEDLCLLWQIDADELWRPQQIIATRAAFLNDPKRSAAWFWCNYYVGPDLMLSTRNNYAENPEQEWLRVWKFKPGMNWDAHEPPTLTQDIIQGKGIQDVGRENPFSHHETEAFGAVFDHFAYVIESQVKFKESYYGYKGAVERWNALQRTAVSSGTQPGFLRNYFPWVSDDAMFEQIDRSNVKPIAHFDGLSGEFIWNSTNEGVSTEERPRNKILIDGIFFQLNSTGIARLWRNLLKTWAATDFASRIIVLDRAGTAPRFEGLSYRTIQKCDVQRLNEDSEYLQWICDRENAALFISTYYTTPLKTPTIFFGYDMIPERLNPNSDDVWWKQKRFAIDSAVGHVMISEDSARELVHFHNNITREDVLVAYCSVDPVFKPCSPLEVSDFKSKYRITRDYVLLVGERSGWLGYKNGISVFAALSLIPVQSRPLLICVGGQPSLSVSESSLLRADDVLLLKLEDDDLRCAYGGARAFICPSLYEGFGLPIVEAMAVGCLVLASRSSVIPEVGGEAAIYFNPMNPAEIAQLIQDCVDARYVTHSQEGFIQIGKFNQEHSAQAIANYIAGRTSMGRVCDCSHSALLSYHQKFEDRRFTLEESVKHLLSTCYELNQTLSLLARRSSNEENYYLQKTDEYITLVEKFLDYTQERAEITLHNREQEVIRQVTVGANRVSIRDIQGLRDEEGPYTRMGIHSAFRWQYEPCFKIEFHVDFDGDIILSVKLSNLTSNQTLAIVVDNSVLETLALPITGWNSELSFYFSLRLSPGFHTLQMRASKFHEVDQDRFYLIWRCIQFR